MRFAFTEQQLLFRDVVRDVLARECPPAAVRATWSDQPLSQLRAWQSLAQLGVVGGAIGERYGGLGLSDLDLVLVLEETGRAALPAPIVEHAVGLRLLEALGAEALAKSWLPKAARGEALIAVAMAAVPYLSHGAEADLFIVQRGTALHVLDRAQIRIERQPSVDGSRRLYSFDFDATADAVLADGSAARTACALALDRGAIGTAAQLIGLGQRMLEMTVDYVKVRHQFGAPIGSFQAIKHALADVVLALELARPLVYRAACSIAQQRAEDERALHASMAKACAGEAAHLAARTALQCHGAIGYSFEHDLHLWMKRVWALERAWGDARWHRERVGQLRIDRQEGES
jgi:alkylation response protein AidB-like acyl-CoA dehydrogenase